jgi:hypothetical protein
MKKNRCMVLCLMAVVLLGAPLFGQTSESLADKVSLALEFNGSIVSVDSEGMVDSMADAGFNEDETKFGIGYEDELWGALASLKFGNENLRIFFAEGADMLGGSPLSIDELYAWVKPFGEHFKFTGGIFENKDGVADYTDDIDDFPMGVFVFGEGVGEPFTEPTDNTNAALVNGFLAEGIFGPVTAQLLLSPNYSKESSSVLASDFFSTAFGSPQSVEAGGRWFRIGGRIIGNIEGIGTVSALFKTFQWPIEITNFMMQRTDTGSKVDFTTFGAYFDLTAIENLGVSLGYTGYLPYNDGDDIDVILWNGIDLRASYTGIEKVSLSTHNNISFAKGAEKEWMGMLPGTDSTFLTLYNAIGTTVTLTEKFSINGEIANVLSITDRDDAGKIEFDEFVAGAKLITHITENVEFDVGLGVTITKIFQSGSYGDADETVTTFSIPVGIKVSL